jgi:hypothetical protein
MTRIAALENARHSAFRSFRCGRSSFLRCTFSAFAGLFICALPLAPPSGAQRCAADCRQRTRGRRHATARAGEPAGQDHAGHRRDACPYTRWRLVDMAARLRCYRLFAPENDHPGQRAPSAIGVGVDAAERTERGDAPGARRRVVRARLWRQGPGARCRDRRPAVAVFEAAATRRAAFGETYHRDLWRSPLRTNVGCAYRGARRQERPSCLGSSDQRSQRRLRPDRRAADRQGEGYRRHHWPGGRW